jgi:hypothetical protein
MTSIRGVDKILRSRWAGVVAIMFAATRLNAGSGDHLASVSIALDEGVELRRSNNVGRFDTMMALRTVASCGLD